jgi:glycyl-tRNA synthetase beta chain
MPDFLLEIGTEEIPARMLDAATEDLRKRVADVLGRERLPAAGELVALNTPRRLAVVARGIPAGQPDVSERITGPAVSVAFKDGQPTPAALAFAKKAGVDVSRLERATTQKGEYLAATVTKKGRAATEILAEMLPKEVAAIYWPKSMYWRKPSERFVRPLRWLVAMLDEQVVPLELGGLRAGNLSRGHRILAGAVKIGKANAYVETLRQAKVLGASEREQQIRKALDAATRKIPGARWREDKTLLQTVVNLTEFPSVILGNFEPEFLALPEEVLVTVMRDHQKYFAIEDANGKLLPSFLAVLNTDSDPDGLIQHGNERVLRARFNDARFFWQTDQKHSLLERRQWLKNVTFQKDLGSYYDKTERVQRLASHLSDEIKNKGVAIRPGIVHKAAALAKTDLTTELVKEFTELQGIVGGLYARVQELDADLRDDVREGVAVAIYDHYKPESMDDAVPRTVEGAVLSVVDKADSIAGMFAVGLIPSGSKDPFALRRQANGIVKTIAQRRLPVSLTVLLLGAYNAYKGSSVCAKFVPIEQYERDVRAFFRERLEFYLRDSLSFSYDVVNAVLAGRGGYDDVVDALARAEAVAKVRPSQDFASIAIAFKRIKNILRQAEEKKAFIGTAPARSDMTEPAEIELFEQLSPIARTVEKLRVSKDYDGALSEMAKIRPTVDTFFDKVMVMVEDTRVRATRLALLRQLLSEFSTIADFSEIVTEGK